MKIKALILILTIFGATTAYAIDENQFNNSHALYLSAVDGNKKQVRDAKQHFKTLSVSGPNNALIQTYIGSLESLMATHVYMPWNKMKHVELGSELMDEAIEEIDETHDNTTIAGTPLSIRMKTIAAHTYFRFPKFLNRYQDAKDLVAEIEESPLFATSSIESKNSIYQLAADIATEEDNEQLASDYLAKLK